MGPDASQGGKPKARQPAGVPRQAAYVHEESSEGSSTGRWRADLMDLEGNTVGPQQSDELLVAESWHPFVGHGQGKGWQLGTAWVSQLGMAQPCDSESSHHRRRQPLM